MRVSSVRGKSAAISLRGAIWARITLVAMGAMLCMGSLSACVSLNPFSTEGEETLAEADGAVEINERNAADWNGVVPVQMSVSSCFVSTALPEGFGAEDVYFYDEERETFNKENGLYVIGENGALSEGWCLVLVSIEARNETDEACRVSLSAGAIDVGHFEGNSSVVVNGSESWIKGGKETKEEYYLPLLESNSAACYDVGFFVRIGELTTNDWLIFRSPGDKGVAAVSSIALGDLKSRLDAAT